MISPRLSGGSRARWYYYRGWTFFEQSYFLSAALDFARALQFDPGHSPSLYALGYMYLRGNGVNRDAEEAARLYLRAARQGYAKAQLSTGILYLDGRGLEQSLDRARYWFSEAAAKGRPDAMLQLGRTYLESEDGDPTLAQQWLERAASEGHAPAQFMLGYLYSEGTLGERHPEDARRWYTAAAQQGDPNAQSSLAWLLATSSRKELRDGELAVVFAKKAVAHTPSPEHLDALAAAWAERGDFDQAVLTEMRAMTALNSGEEGERARDYGARLASYRERRAWRE